ncbi:MAG: riboflavin biosynthesis protein RibF [Phascolarctobacterium sp.]|nr:riboflavin biosynthesis protein RibF [Phascolarctobacterium sp.]
MEIIHSLEELHRFNVPCVIALGTFDGLHLGHYDVIKTAKEYAVSHGQKLVVFTFSNHPLSLIKPELAPEALLPPFEKQCYIKRMGVDVLLDIVFDEHLARMTPEDFLATLRVLDYRCLVIGENFSFGFHGEGNSRTLQRSAREIGFKLIVRPLISDEGTIVSSTEIRRRILAGDIEAANKMLGRAYSLCGIVVKGKQRGREIGFPTANIELDNSDVIIPGVGVYAAKVLFDGREYEGMANIGRNPTFGDLTRTSIEVNIFDYAGDLYGRKLIISFYHLLRREEKFPSAEMLKKRIEQDKEICREYFINFSKNYRI